MLSQSGFLQMPISTIVIKATWFTSSHQRNQTNNQNGNVTVKDQVASMKLDFELT